MKLSVAELFVCSPNSELARLCEEFRRMVVWWLGRAEESPKASYQQLRDKYSGGWKDRWGENFNMLYGQTSCMVAWSLHRQHGKTEFNLPILVLNPYTIRKVGLNGLTISVNRDRRLQIQLEINTPHQRILLEQAEAGKWQPGQAVLTPKWALLTLTTTLNPATKETPEIEAILKES